MKYNRKFHSRRSKRLRTYDYSQPGAYFVTMVVKNRIRLFGEIINGEMILNEYGKVAAATWYDLPNHVDNIELDEFVIMPEHVHFIIRICSSPVAIHELPRPANRRDLRRKMLLPKIIGRYKMVSSKQINILRNTPGIHVWQRDYYEHIIRNTTALNRIRRYIKNNPIRFGNS